MIYNSIRNRKSIQKSIPTRFETLNLLKLHDITLKQQRTESRCKKYQTQTKTVNWNKSPTRFETLNRFKPHVRTLKLTKSTCINSKCKNIELNTSDLPSPFHNRRIAFRLRESFFFVMEKESEYFFPHAKHNPQPDHSRLATSLRIWSLNALIKDQSFGYKFFFYYLYIICLSNRVNDSLRTRVAGALTD